MKIVLHPQVYADLEYVTAQTLREFSGLATVEIDGSTLYIDSYALLSVGSEVLTEFHPNEAQDLKGDVRCWFHRHPLGDDKPGEHCWSSTDEETIQLTPLGGVPEIVGWSVSIVRTPAGWVGRIDNHIKKITKHLDVETSDTELPPTKAVQRKYKELLAQAPQFNIIYVITGGK